MKNPWFCHLAKTNSKSGVKTFLPIDQLYLYAGNEKKKEELIMRPFRPHFLPSGNPVGGCGIDGS